VTQYAQTAPDSLCRETFTQTFIGTEADPLVTGQSPSATVIAVTTLYADLLQRIA